MKIQKRQAGGAIRLAQAAVIVAGLMGGIATEPAWGGPANEQIVRGNVTFERDGNRTIIRASDGSIINYASFDILPWETVRFIQPNDLARVLNRINSNEPTVIQGRLLANGQVYLVNPAGVTFTGGSVVNVGTLYAGAGTLRNSDFIAGRDKFRNLEGEVINRGLINGDNVHLVGSRVENHGVVRANRGVVTMLAGDTVYIREHGERITVSIDGKVITDRNRPRHGETVANITDDAAVVNTGTVEARRGTVVFGAGDLYGHAIHNLGTVSAERGEITLAATDGAIHNEGLITTSTDTGTAGSVVVQAPSVLNSGEIRADSNYGRSGSVEVTSQDHTFLRPGSVISAAGGSRQARGGDVLVHSYDGQTVFADGAIVDVSGARYGGHGGFAEVSGENIIYNGQTKLEASNGYNPGALLIDPVNLIVNETGGDDAFIEDDNIFGFTEGDTDSFIAADTFLALVGDITLQATGSIGIFAPIVLDPANGNTNLTLQAFKHINIDAPIIGAENLFLMADFDNNNFGSVSIHDPLEISGSIEIWGTDIFMLGGLLSSTGSQTYHADTWLGEDLRLVASNIVFEQRVNSKPIHPNRSLDIVVGDKVVFNGGVGDDGNPPPNGFPHADGVLRWLRVDGATEVNGGLVRTNLFQRFMGPVTVGNDALFTAEQAGQIRFDGTLDGNVNVAVNTAGETRFHGDVGGTAPLRSLVTDAPGSTRLRAVDITATDVIFGDPVNIRGDVTIDGDSSVVFRDTIDGNGNDLVINSPKTEFFGDVTEMGLLQTDADGDTAIDTALISGEQIDFGDSVFLGTDALVFGREFVNFDGTIDNFYELLVISEELVRFGGDIGMFRPLKALAVQSGERGAENSLINRILFDGTRFVMVEGDVLLNPQGKDEPYFVASVASTGDITIKTANGDIFFGANEKMTSLGLLELLAENGTITTGDLNSFGDMIVKADTILIRLREAADLITYLADTILDGGVDFVSARDIDFEFNNIGVIGDGRFPVFLSQQGIAFQDPRTGEYVFISAETLREEFELNPILDLTAIRVLDALIPSSTANLATAFDNRGKINDRLYLDPASLRPMERLALYLRDFTSNELVATTSGRELYMDSPTAPTGEGMPLDSNIHRLRGSSVLKVIDRHAGIFLRETQDPATGAMVQQDQTDAIRDTLRSAWDGFATQQDPPEDFRAWLVATPEHADALAYIDGLSELFAEARTMGVTPREYRLMLDAVLGPITPLSMEQDVLEGAMEGRSAQASAEPAPVQTVAR